jgi:formylmethanofuran dehydrogenase subunit E
MSVERVAIQAALSRLAGRHQHLCPRQVLGVRGGLHAAAWLGIDVPQTDKRLLALVEMDGCFADGVSAATGCWLGRRTLRLIDHGKTAVTLVDTVTGRAVRVAPRADARARAIEAAPAGVDRWQAQLEGYQNLADASILRAVPVVVSLDLAALISRPGLRVCCELCGEEITNEREVRLGSWTVCRGCAGDQYYRVVSPLDEEDHPVGQARATSTSGPWRP